MPSQKHHFLYVVISCYSHNFTKHLLYLFDTRLTKWGKQGQVFKKVKQFSCAWGCMFKMEVWCDPAHLLFVFPEVWMDSAQKWRSWLSLWMLLEQTRLRLIDHLEGCSMLSEGLAPLSLLQLCVSSCLVEERWPVASIWVYTCSAVRMDEGGRAKLSDIG